MDGSPGVLTGTFAGRYVIERELGHGATATVYLARDTRRGHAVAIKVLKPELAASVGTERFLREISVNEKLHHPGIVPVLDSGEHTGVLFFVLPHMDGGSLRQRLLRERQLPLADAIGIAVTIAQALDHAHKQGLIHRDVKPENILFTAGEACLADFGIARAIERTIDESTTSTGLVRGTPAYMSPEQASGSKHYDGRSDIYSLACVLYEMIAGMPAFIGPTPEAVIAQRFQHAPRELRVYRQSVPPQVEAVIQKALELSAVDRYSTAREFAEALTAAMRSSLVEPRTSGASVGMDTSRRVATWGAVAFAVLLVTVLGYFGRRALWPDTTVLDTTRVVVLPFEGIEEAGVNLAIRGAFARWRGLSVASPMELSDITRGRESAALSDAGGTSRSLAAGRYVRGRMQRVGPNVEIDAGLYDTESGSQVAHATMRLPVERLVSDSAYFPLANALLLRDTSGGVAWATTSLPAAQTYISALRAIDNWELLRADSLLQSALSYERGFPLASFRLAQVRSWQNERAERWLPLAQMAAADSLRLSEPERAHLAGLMALAERRFLDACRIYDEARRRSDRDFAAWYGLGKCHGDDDAVLRDPNSPSGWRFRSSAHRATLAYARAFELLPAVHRGFRRGAYRPLRELLYTKTTTTRQGRAVAPDSGVFIARPMWIGDSLATIPYPLREFSAGRGSTQVASIVRAVEHQRELFSRIAMSWSAALPQSAGAKEAVAVALEMRGDPAALDTLRLARQMTTDSSQQLRLGTAEAMLLVKFGLPADAGRLRQARRLADSLLSGSPPAQPGDARNLARLAALTGRCEQAVNLAAQSPTPSTDLPLHVVGMAQALSIGALLGCRRPDDAALRRIADAIAATVADQRRRDVLLYIHLGQIGWLLESRDTAWLARLSAIDVGGTTSARRRLFDGDTAGARAILRRIQETRAGWRPVDISLDALLAEASLLAAIGDTASAVRWVAPALNNARFLPEETLASEIGVASFTRLIDLYTQLAGTTAGREWRTALEILRASQP